MNGVVATDCRVMQISKVRMNLYVSLLQQSLRELGISCTTADSLSPRLVQSWRGVANVLHVHWLELLYVSPSLARSMRLLAAVLGGLVWARVKGFRLVYTVHNLAPHEQPFVRLDRLASRMLFALADAVHVHDQEARLAVARNYGRHRGVYVVPHGSYVGAYPNHCTKQEARTWLKLPQGDAFVYLFLGQVRRYKGVEDLIAAFNRLDDHTCCLVLAGNVHDSVYGEELLRLAYNNARVITWLRYIPDSELQYFMNACDVCVFPYREVTTSGAAILAFSFGKPIIAPALGGFMELAADGRGIVYDPSSADGLLGALQKAREMDVASAGQRALAWARQHEWRVLAPEFARIYADVLRAQT